MGNFNASICQVNLVTCSLPPKPSSHRGCLPSPWPSSSVLVWGRSACAAGRRNGWSLTVGCPCRPSPGRCRSPAHCGWGSGSFHADRSFWRGRSSLRSQNASAGASPARSSSSQHPQLSPWGQIKRWCLTCTNIRGIPDVLSGVFRTSGSSELL